MFVYLIQISLIFKHILKILFGGYSQALKMPCVSNHKRLKNDADFSIAGKKYVFDFWCAP